MVPVNMTTSFDHNCRLWTLIYKSHKQTRSLLSIDISVWWKSFGYEKLCRMHDNVSGISKKCMFRQNCITQKQTTFFGFGFLHIVSTWINHNWRCIKSYTGRFEENRILTTSVGGLKYYKSQRPNPVHDLFPKHMIVLICVLSFRKKYIRLSKLWWVYAEIKKFQVFC